MTPSWKPVALLSSSLALTCLCAVVAELETVHAQSARQVPKQDRPAEHKHFISSKEAKKITIIDPRFPLITEIRYATYKDKVVVGGDMVLGTVHSISDATVAELASTACQFSPSDPTLGLTETQKEALSKLAALHKARDQDWTVASRKIAVRRLLMQAIKTSSSNDKDAFGEARNAIDKLHKEMGNVTTLPLLPSEQAVSIVQQFRWPNGVIPYTIDPSYPTPELIEQAIAHWHSKTDRIRLVQVTPTNAHIFHNWVKFVLDEACLSNVGKIPEKGEQTIHLGSGCLVPQIIHEIGHCVGMFHEMDRTDRDRFISINRDMILDHEEQFALIGPDATDTGNFDFDSIMLYPPLAFSADNTPVMTKIGDPSANFGIYTPGKGGRTTGLSPGDIKGVEVMYPFPARLPPATK